MLQSSAKGIVSCGDVRDQFTKGHGTGVGAEGILLRRHGFSDGDGKFAQSAEVLRILRGGRRSRADGVHREEDERNQKCKSDGRAGFHRICFEDA